MDERDPVADSEYVYRRIHPFFYKSALPLAVLFQAFRPTKQDTTGLSVVRAALALPSVVLPDDPVKAKGYQVARLAVRDLRNLALNVVPEPIFAGPPGHAVIPELAWHAYEADKTRWKPILVELARLASADIVHGP